MKLLKVLAVLVIVAAAFGGGYIFRAANAKPSADASARRILYYVDPMHPAYTSDRPGIAPDCGMALEPVYAEDAAAAAAPNGKLLHYRDPEDHTYTSDKAGLNPETGNTLEPVHEEPAPGTIRVTSERQQLIGVRFAEAEWMESGRTLRTLGTVAYDETRLARIHPRVEGWIEKVFVDFTGALVKQGQPLLTIYSPELLASQQELLLARRARDLMADNPMASASQSGTALFDAARRRLELWQLSAGQIDRVLETGEPIRSVTLHSPVSGFVLERQAFPNQKVSSETELYSIADLSRVWIMAEVYEADLASVRAGMQARVTFTSGSAPLTARVAYVQPQIDPATRTMKVRLEAANPGMRLKPDMFVNIEFTLAGARQLTVPAEAVVDTGTRQTVFVDLGDGYLSPRQVTVGGRIGDRIVIASGLAGGERVVASATFLIDSESQLKNAASGMGAPSKEHEGHRND